MGERSNQETGGDTERVEDADAAEDVECREAKAAEGGGDERPEERLSVSEGGGGAGGTAAAGGAGGGGSGTLTGTLSKPPLSKELQKSHRRVGEHGVGARTK